MLDVEYKGGNGVILTTKKSTLVVDPNLSSLGLKNISLKGAVELATEARFLVQGSEAVLSLEGPGAYEVGDFSIKGVAAQRHLDSDGKQSTMYRIEVGDVRIALLGNVDEHLTDDQLEALGVVDVLILPVGGGGYTLDATAAAGVTRRIDPKAVVPVHYADPAVRYEVPQSELVTFISELSAPVETVSKLKLKSSSALPQTLTVFEITRS